MAKNKQSLEELKSRIAFLKKKNVLTSERKKLEKELFELENPGLVSVKKGTVAGAKAFGRGLVVTVKGVKRFADRQAEAESRRELLSRKLKSGVRPGKKKAKKRQQQRFVVVQQPRKKRKQQRFVVVQQPGRTSNAKKRRKIKRIRNDNQRQGLFINPFEGGFDF